MELALSMGDPPARPLTPEIAAACGSGRKPCTAFKLGRLCIGLAVNGLGIKGEEVEENRGRERDSETEDRIHESVNPPVQLNLLPLETLHRLDKAKHRNLEVSMRVVNAKRGPSKEESGEGAAMSSSPNSTAYSFKMEDLAGGVGVVAAETVVAAKGNGGPRKKLRLSKEQSAFLEKSFKEHKTLSARQKLALARQLNLRPRQVEVWFQNRRARTKLKQTEVDCEYMKRRCEKLREENRRLQKELAALRSSQPFCMQPPSSMCLSCCQRFSSIAADTASSSAASASGNPSSAFLFPNSRFYSFAGPPPPAPPYLPSATS